ncbi:MAG: molybdopterin molybdotransferase MoeA [Pseudomonadota bacterium]
MSEERRLIDDCFLHDKDRLRHDEALAILNSSLSAIVGTETVPLKEASRRILAQDVIAPRPIPLTDNAAVDGFAFRHDDVSANSTVLSVSSRHTAGRAPGEPLMPGTAARIFTGAAMPEGADTVGMQEDCFLIDRADGQFVEIPVGLKPGANRRLAGEDVSAGDTIAKRHQTLRPQDVAAVASTGQAEITVFQRLKVGIVSSGDEIKRPGEEIHPGEVYDANHFLLRSLLTALDVTLEDFGVLPDRLEDVENKLREMAERCDVILTSGGASRGDEDHMLTALDRLGKRHLWQLAVKPGRPMMFGQIRQQQRDAVLFGLPGNPVAVMVCYLMYVHPSLVRLGGGVFPEPQRYPVPSGFEIVKKKPDRREFVRSWLEQDGSNFKAVKFPQDGSGLISSLRAASGLIEIPEEVTSLKIGEPVRYIPFSEFGIV